MRANVPRLSIAVAVSAPLAASLLVAPDSPCSKFCGNVLSSISREEMPCDSGSLTRSSKGLVWEQCVDCLLTSTHVSGNETDLQWLLYNLRFNMGYCLFDSGPNNPCVTRTACGELEDAIKYQNFSTTVGVYDYCRNWEADFVPKCSTCLDVLDDGQYLINYMTVLEAACEQKPSTGSTVSIQGDLFGSEDVVIVPPQPAYASVPSTDYGPISLGGRVGIAFGGFAFLLAVAGFCIVCNGKRKRRAFLRDLQRRHEAQGWPHPSTRYGGGGSDMFETPVSQKPLRGWETESPVSAHTDGAFPRYFSPYSSQYNSPVSPGSAGPVAANWPSLPTQQQFGDLIQQQSPVHGSPPPAFTQWPTVGQEKLLMQQQMQYDKRQQQDVIGVALGGDEARSPYQMLNHNGYPVDSKGKERGEEYEMDSPYSSKGNTGTLDRDYRYPMPTEPRAPVLHHPGYGRHHRSRPGADDGTGGIADAALSPRNGAFL